MRGINEAAEFIGETSPLTLAALGVAALVGAPVIKSGLRGLTLAVVKGGLALSDQLSQTVNSARGQWEGIVADAKSYTPPYNFQDVNGTAVGAGVGGAIGAGLGSMVAPPVGTTAGGGIGGAVGAMVGKEMAGQTNDVRSSSPDQETAGPRAVPNPKPNGQKTDKPEK